MFQEDWIMRQIQDMVSILLKLLKLDSPAYSLREEQDRTEPDLLWCRLDGLFGERRFREADDLLQERMNPKNIRFLYVALDFYSRVNALDDAALEKAGYSRKQAEDGLREAAHAFGFSFL